jgi:TPR repeat protein
VLQKGRGGVPANATRAARWFRRGAERGDAAALFFWGVCLLRGDGVGANATAGWEALNASAASGEWDRAEAAPLGDEDDLDNATEVADFCRALAERGLPGGQYLYGICLETGRGVGKDAVARARGAAARGAAREGPRQKLDGGHGVL